MKVKNIVFSGAMASILMIGAATAADSVTTTDVTFGGKYKNNTLNVADDINAISFNYQGTQADGTPTGDISASTTGTAENIVKSNFAYTLADGTPTNLANTSTEWTKADYIANTVAGTNEGGNDYSKVHVAEGYGLNANTDVVDSSYSYENPQYNPVVAGSEQYITLDKNGSARTLKTTYSTNETYTSGSVELTSTTAAADLISAYSYQTTDGAGNPTSHKYVLSSDGLGVKDLTNDGQGVNLNDPSIDPTLKTALQGMLDAYTTDSGTNLTNAKNALANLQEQENNNFTAAKNAYTADNTKQGQLVSNYDTYTAATTALRIAEGIDTTKSGEYNTANNLLMAAREVYDAPITDTIDTRANNVITTSLAEGGAIHTAVKDAWDKGEAWIGQELGYDTTTTDANTVLTDAGFTAVEIDEAGNKKASVVSALIENKDAIDVLNGDKDTSGSVAYAVAQLAQGAVKDNADAIADIKNNQLGEINDLAATVATPMGGARIAENLSGTENATVSDHLTKLATVAADTKDAVAAETTRAQDAEAAIRGEFAAADEATLTSAKSYADGKIESLSDSMMAADAKLRNDIAALDSKMSDLDENLSAGIASSVALSSVAVANVQKGEMSVGGGYGNYNSKSAMAFGAALGITDNWSANAGVGFGFGKDTKASFRVGTNYKFKLF